MMDGITILSEVGNNTSVVIFAGLVASLFCGLTAIIIYTCIKNRLLEVIFIGFFPFFMAVIFTIAAMQNVAESQYYKVSIDDSVSFTEFTSKYKVLNQEGQIYTIKEKEQND